MQTKEYTVPRMSTQQSTVDELLDRLRDSGRVSAKKMFGEYCVYLNDKPVALVCDDILYVKSTPAGKALLVNVEEGRPYPNAKPHLIVPIDLWSKVDLLTRLIRTTFDALPKPKPKPIVKPKRRT
jgi:DNA transformation protein